MVLWLFGSLKEISMNNTFYKSEEVVMCQASKSDVKYDFFIYWVINICHYFKVITHDRLLSTIDLNMKETDNSSLLGQTTSVQKPAKKINLTNTLYWFDYWLAMNVLSRGPFMSGCTLRKGGTRMSDRGRTSSSSATWNRNHNKIEY